MVQLTINSNELVFIDNEVKPSQEGLLFAEYIKGFGQCLFFKINKCQYEIERISNKRGYD